ncbi:MAG TPA: efflux transporter outer membrane subunit, partial [Nitrospirota bacterium]
MKTTSLLLLSLSMTLGLLACASVGPDYRQPHLDLPSNWQSAQSGKLADVRAWWASFHDPVLNTLLDAAQKDNPTLVKAAAAIEKARANRSAANAGFFPTLDAQATATRSGSLGNSAGLTSSSGSLQVSATSARSSSAGLSSSWEIDLFGKIRRSSESAGALEQAREADWYGARVSLVAEAASTYVDYRACRIKQKYYEEQAGSQSKTSELTAISARAGFTAPADARLAEASAASTRSTALAQQAECEVLIKSLVALTGMKEPLLRQTLGQDTPSLPQPEGFTVAAVPADLLRLRPDIVSAERTLASASALIGVAEAAHYPSFSLSGSVSLASTDGTRYQPWSFGPTLTLPIFSGGRIKAGV